MRTRCNSRPSGGGIERRIGEVAAEVGEGDDGRIDELATLARSLREANEQIASLTLPPGVAP